MIAGAGPLTRPEFAGIAGDSPLVVFLLVINGNLLTEIAAGLRWLRNTTLVLSIEGNSAETDSRRGRGVHENLQAKTLDLNRSVSVSPN